MRLQLRRVRRREFGQAFAALAALGCGAEAGASGKRGPGLRVAAFRCDVTPPLGMPIYPSYRPVALRHEGRGGRHSLRAGHEHSLPHLSAVRCLPISG